MLNFIVLALLNYFVAAHLKVEGTLHTAEIHAGALPRLSEFVAAFHGSAANVVLFLAILAARRRVVVSVPHARAASSFARPDSSRRPRSTAG